MDKTRQEASRYEADENGQNYKENGELLPNNAYKVHGNIYQMDGLGNIVSCDARPVYTEEVARNRKEQLEMKTSGYAGNAGMEGIMQAAKLLVEKGRICDVQKNEFKENH